MSNGKLATLIMVQGVSSNAGKSVLTKSLCRYYANLGYKVTTFKPILVCQDEIISNGVLTDIRMEASIKACRANVSVHNNPIKVFAKHKDPSSKILSPALMSIEDEEPFEINLFARDAPMFNRLSDSMIERITKTIDVHLGYLMKNYQIVIIEGAGNPTDLGESDLTNYYIPENYPVNTLLVSKLYNGGAAASILGTYSLLSPSIKKNVKGYILNDYIDGMELVDEITSLLSKYINIDYLGLFPHVWKDIIDLQEDEQLDYLANVLGSNVNLSKLISEDYINVH